MYSHLLPECGRAVLGDFEGVRMGRKVRVQMGLRNAISCVSRMSFSVIKLQLVNIFYFTHL